MSGALSLGARKNVLGGHQLDIHKSGLADGLQILSFQESSGNSSSPQVNVRPHGIWHWTVHRDIR